MKLLRNKCCYVLFCFLYLRYLPALQLGRQTKTILQIAQHPQKNGISCTRDNYSNRFNANDYCSGSTVYYFLTRKWHI